MYLFLRDRENAEEGQREMGTENPTHALHCPEIMTWAEPTITRFAATHVSPDYLFFFHLICFPAVLRINWPYRCEFISAFPFYWSLHLCRCCCRCCWCCCCCWCCFLPGPYCSSQYSFLIQPEVWNCDASSFSFLLQFCFCCLGSLSSHTNFGIICCSSLTNVSVSVIGISLHMQIVLRSVDILTVFSASHPWGWNLFPFLCVLFLFFHQCFTAFRVQIFHLFG